MGKNIFFRNLLTLSCIGVSLISSAAPTDSLSAGKQPTVGLVLSGGGAKGIAHVGVIKALEENDIPIDFVTGTSMGAIVGSLYSCGWSPEKMESFFTAPDFKYWSTGTINKNLVYYTSTPRPTPKWVSLNVNFKDTANIVNQIIPANLISPIPMNLEFLRLYAPYTRQCDANFNKLFVPFRCVTSDVYHKRKIVLSDGSLGDAVRASMSFPLVFKPIKMDGVLVYDGGIYDNFPVDVMQEDFNPDFIIGVSVSSPDKKPKEGDVYSQLEDMIIQNNNYSVPAKNGIKIQVPVLNFGVLEFDKANEIYQIGYRTGLAMVDSIKKRVSARTPMEDVKRRREKFAASTPELYFDSVKVTNATPVQAAYIQYLFRGPRHSDRIGMSQMSDSYYRAVTDGTLSNLFPQARFGKDGVNTLLLEATVKRPWSIGVGGWITSSTNSMLYLGLGFHTLSFNSLDVSLDGWIGQSYYAGMLTGQFALRTYVPSYIQIQGVMSKQKYYDNELLFYETSTPTFITENENYLRLNYVRAFGRRVKGYAGIGYGYLRDSYYPTNVTDYSSVGKDKSIYHIWALKAGFESNTLNDVMYPTSGYEWSANVTASHEKSKYRPGAEGQPEVDGKGHFRGSLELRGKRFFSIAKNFNLGIAGQALGTLQRITQNYTATLIHAPAFAPTPSTRNYFNQRFRSDNYVAAGVIPIWIPISRMQVRGDFFVYSPIRHLVEDDKHTARFDGWFKKPQFVGEIAGVYNFPFASLSIYCNYLSYPVHNWNFGINFGLLIQAPKFLH